MNVLLRLFSCIFLLCSFLPDTVARAQSISILNLDTRRFPELSAAVVVTDESGNRIWDVAPEDLEITENDSLIEHLTVDCPPRTPVQGMTSVLVCDQSSSMNLPAQQGGMSRLELLKRGLIAFIGTVDFAPPTSVAITAFNEHATLIHDFTNDPVRLQIALSALRGNGGTLYNPPMLDPFAGAIPLLKSMPDFPPRFLIFVTDGQPYDDLDVDAIIAECRAAKIKVFVITLAMPMFPPLESIAVGTGGEAFGEVHDEATMKNIYRLIALKTQEQHPCTVTWRSFTSCQESNRQRTVRITYKPRNISATVVYRPPGSFTPRMEVDPGFVYFGPTVPPNATLREVKITARGATYTITGASLPPDLPFSVVDWGGTPPPFELADGQSRTLSIRFAPTETGLYGTTLQLLSGGCRIPPIMLSGGILGPDAPAALQLLAPIGGEIFAGCDSVLIRWTGIHPLDTVVIEYSDNNGAGWKLITDKGMGLLHRWMPPASGDRYRIRISTPPHKRVDIVNTFAGGGDGSGDHARDQQLSGPSSFAIAGDLLFLAESGRHVVSMIDTRTGIYSIVAGTGEPGFNNDGGAATASRLLNPTGVAFYDRYLFIADLSNNRVRRVDMVTGIITTVAGNGLLGSDGDGGPAVAANLSSPSHVAVANDMLYIADGGNNRIRQVDLRTGIIRTVAGGGTIPGGEDIIATSALLRKPAGMAIVSDELNGTDTLFFAEEQGHIIRRLDIRRGMLTTAAGTGTPGFSGDGGRATDAWLFFPQDVVAAGPRLYIADTRNYRVREFNRLTRTIRTVAGSGRNGFSGDEGPALDAAFSPIVGVGWQAPDKLYVADSENERVRLVTLGDVGRRDSSRASFTVASPQLRAAVRFVELGNLAIDATRDTTLTNALCNLGTAPSVIDSIVMIGTNAGDFTVVSGIAAGAIPPGGCQPLEIRFRPQGLGRRTAQAVVYGTCGDVDTLTLNAMALPSCGLSSLERNDFGEIALGGSSGDVVLNDVICNNGTQPMQVDLRLSPADGPFAIVAGGGTITLLPGECHDITIDFTPQRGGRVSAQIDYTTLPYCERMVTQLTGRGLASEQIEVAAAVQIPALRCDIISHDTTISIRNRGNTPLVVTGAELASNNEGFSLLPPVPTTGAPLTILPGATGSIGLRLRPATHGVKSALLRITSNGSPVPTDVELSGRFDSLALIADDPLLVFDGKLPATGFPRDSFVVIRNTGTAAMTITAGAITGTNADKFQLPGTQFPLVIQPGDSAQVLVRALEPVAGAGYRGVLDLTAEPACDGPITVELFEVGAQPALAALPPRFRDLLCPDDAAHDSTLLIRNPGGAELRITGYDLRGAGAGAFIFTPALPVIVPAGGETTLPIRFAPPGPGTFAAELALAGNAEGGETVLQLSGRRETLAWTLSATELRIGHVMPGAEGTGTILIRNTGSVTVQIELPDAIGPFDIRTPSPVTIAPGEEMSLEVALRSAVEGDFADTLLLQDLRCAPPVPVPLSANVFTPAFTVVDLPEDSAGPGERVSLPIRITIPDRGLFALKGARHYTAVITFNGAILVPVAITGGTIVQQSYDPVTALRRLTITGEYPGTGDTLAVLTCNVPSSGLSGTPLTFEEFTWDHPHVFPQELDGFFTLLDSCYTGGMLLSRPRVLKIRPMPVGNNAVAEIELEEVHTIRVVLVDPLGREAAVIAEGRYNAGRHELPIDLRVLPAGPYTLVITTPFNQTTERIVVVK